METHDRIGVEIINSAFNSAELTNIVRNHHATFGGEGRDPGLPVGRDIPLRARILTIADAYDAMISDRVYRKGRSSEAAFEERRRCSNTQFDPELVERFIGVVKSRHFGAEPRPASQSTEVVLSLGLATERLTAALDANDMKGVAAMAHRLGTLATSLQWAEVAELAGELNDALDDDPDLGAVLESTRDLLNLYLSTQNEFLSSMGRSPEHEAA